MSRRIARSGDSLLRDAETRSGPRRFRVRRRVAGFGARDTDRRGGDGGDGENSTNHLGSRLSAGCRDSLDYARWNLSIEGSRTPGIDRSDIGRYCTLTIEVVRGHLPPIAATLNNVLKRDAPGGLLYRPGLFVSRPDLYQRSIADATSAPRLHRHRQSAARILSRRSW